jgi:hypothetical protein
MRNATSLTASTLGAIMGLAGLEHGLGEILQGNVAPPGIMFLSWPDSAFFRSVGGEPAMTLIPNLLVTGILAVLISLIVLVWATRFIHQRNGGPIMMLLCLGLLLTGGGIFPPVIGIVVGGVATQINTPLSSWPNHHSIGLRQFLAQIWPGVFAINLLAWLSLFPGMNLLGYFLGVNNPNLTLLLIVIALGSLLLTIFSGFARDIQYRAVLHDTASP